MSSICEGLKAIGLVTAKAAKSWKEKWGKDLDRRKDPAKSRRYDHMMVTDTLLGGLVSNPADVISKIQKGAAAGGIGTDIPANIYGDFTRVFSTPYILDNNQIMQDLDKMSEAERGSTLRNRALAMHHLREAAKGQNDLYNAAMQKYPEKNVAKELMTLVDSNTGLLKLHSSLVEETIGREIAESSGLVLTQEARAKLGEEGVKRLFKELGKAAIEDLQKIGLVNIQEITTRGPALLNNPNKPFKESATGETDKSLVITQNSGSMITFNVKGDEAANLKTYITSDIVEQQKVEKDVLEFHKTMQIANAIYKVAMPRNKYVPKGEGKDHDTIHDSKRDEIRQVDEMKEVLDALGHTPMYMDKGFLSMLKFIKQEYDKALEDGTEEVTNSTKDYTYHKIVNSLSKDKRFKKYAFFIDPEAVFEAVDQRAEISKQISYANPLKLILEDLDMILEVFDNDGVGYTDHRIGKNARLVNMLTTLNVQADNKVSRPVLTLEPYEIEMTSENMAHIFADFDDNHMSGEQSIVDLWDPSKKLGEMVEDFASMFMVQDKDGMWKLDDDLKSTEVKGGFKGTITTTSSKYIDALQYLIRKENADVYMHKKSVYHGMNAMVAMVQIKKAVDKKIGKTGSNKIRTTYMMGADASASGGLIKGAQAIAYKNKYGNYGALGALSQLGLIDKELAVKYKVDAEKELKDFYEFLVVAITKDKDAGKLDKKVQEMYDNLVGQGKLFSRDRDLLKPSIMTFLYGQSSKNNMAELRGYIVSEIYGTGDEKLILKYLKEAGVELEEGEAYNDVAVKNRLGQAYTGLSEYVLGKLESEYVEGMFGTYDATLKTLASTLEAIAKDKNYEYSIEDMSVMTPESKYYLKDEDFKEGGKYEGKNRRDFNTSLLKVFNVAKDGEIYQEEMANQPTVMVIAQHMIDAATMKIAYKKYIDRVIKPKYGKDWKKHMPTTQHIHDQIRGSVEFSKKYEEYYREALKEVNEKYDFVEELVNEIEYAASTKKEGAPETVKYKVHTPLDKIREELDLDNTIELKQEWLNKGWNRVNKSFGYGAYIEDRIKQYEGIIKNGNEVTSSKEAVDERVAALQSVNDKLKNGYVVLDTETNGLDKDKHTVIELVAKKYNKNGILLDSVHFVDTKTSKVDLDKETEFDSETVAAKKRSGLKVAGTDPKDRVALVKSGMNIITNTDEALSKLQKLTRDIPIVGHNVEFDVGMINSMLNRNGKDKLTSETLDTIEIDTIDRQVAVDGRSLETVLVARGLKTKEELKDSHLASVDVDNTNELLMDMLKGVKPTYEFKTKMSIADINAAREVVNNKREKEGCK